MSEKKLLRIGTLLLAVTFIFTVAVLFFCYEQDRELAAHGVNIQLMVEEGR